MAREEWISRSGLILGVVVALLVGIVFVGWWRLPKAGPTPAAPSVIQASTPGWEIRYNASIALARRGSDQVRECYDILAEMLDEDQQLANRRTRGKDGKEVVNEVEARETVLNGLKALEELHRRRPDLDLTELNPALDKLKQSPNIVLRTAADRTQIALRSKD